MAGGLSIDDAISLAGALRSHRVIAGDTISIVTPGTYGGDYVCTLTGTSGARITVRNDSGGRVIIDGSFSATGAYADFFGLEFCNSAFTNRQSAYSGQLPADIDGRNFQADGASLGFYGCVIHDFYSPTWYGQGGIMHGCISYHHGWAAPGGERHGHGLYLGNNSGTVKTVSGCAFFDNFHYGFHAYRESGFVDDLTVQDNVFYCGLSPDPPVFLLGWGGVSNRPIVQRNVAFSRSAKLGYVGGSVDATVDDNRWLDTDLTLNVANYLSNTGNYDGALGNQVKVVPYTHVSTAGLVIVENALEAGTVTVDLTAITGLSVGDNVTVANVQDYFSDLQTLTLDADKKIVINMQVANRTVSAPIGWTSPETTFPAFGVFVVTKV